jgi:glutaredoxin
MSNLKRLIDRARQAAEDHLPQDVVEAGRKLRTTVVEHAPPTVREAIERYVPEDERGDVHESAAAAASPEGDPDDAPVVIYATLAERESVENIRKIFARNDVHVREVDLEAIPKMARQIAQDTNVFVPPYVFIGGRFWGAEFDIVSLEADGDLLKVVEGRLDEISEGARRIGHVHESFSDALTPENIVDRLRRGHILCIDELDCWFEEDKKSARLYYQGQVHDGERLGAIAEEIAAAADAEEIEAQWRFEPEVMIAGR